MSIKEILEQNGYPVLDGGTYLSTKALFRNGDNPTAICVYPKDDVVIDFVTGERYDIKTLIQKVLGINDKREAEEYIQKNNVIIRSDSIEFKEKLIEAPKSISSKFLDKIEPKHDYWLKRGISEEILSRLKGGIYNGRYFFPIYNGRTLVGFTARDVTGRSKVKWLHKGRKSDWIWPSIEPVIASKEVFLVESPGDTLSLMESGVENVLCVFGSVCSWRIINELLKIPKIKINISFNSDLAGQNGGQKTFDKLKKYFDLRQIKMRLPVGGKDWNEVLLSEDGKRKIFDQLKKTVDNRFA